jgi:serine phosphatase RsbU (regulator of sigma subunit)/transcriptional regulator with GAF, ATPase, and Fis domain/anti-sigma regulatory factor (Ser/Thr protein kinase)
MPPITSTAAFKASYKNLAEISSFVTRAAEASGLSEGAIYAVQRAVDEACSNIIEHAYQGIEGGKIDCLCIACDSGLIIRFHDNGVPFDPRKIPSPDIHADLTKRPVGGLGLYFMRRLMDEVSFEFSPSTVGNSVTMVKYNDRHIRAGIWPRIISLAEEVMKLPTLTEQLSCICDLVKQIFDGQVNLWLTPAWVKASATSLSECFESEPPNEIMARAFHTKRGTHHGVAARPSSDNSGTQDVDGDESVNNVGTIATPIITNDQVVGVIQVERSGRTFSSSEAIAFDCLASQAAMALNATRQAEVEKWRLEQLNLVRSVSAQLASVTDLDELARRVTRLILDTFNYYYTAIFTCQKGEETLNFRASYGPKASNGIPQAPATLPLQVQLGNGLIGLAASSGKEIIANDIRSESRYQFHDSLPGTLAEVALPLKIGTEVLGVLDVQSDTLDSFDDTDMLVLRALADNIAIAVEGTRLYTALRRRADQLTSVAEVSNAITSILNLDDLLTEVIHLISERLGYPYVQILTVNLALGEIKYVTGSSPKNSELSASGCCYSLDDPVGLIPWVARNAATIIANDVSKESRYRPSGEFPIDVSSELVVPLVFGGQVQGILDVQSDRLNAFSEEDRFLFEALADNIAIAMRNAQLYRSEAWRRQVADSMHAVAGLLSADVSLSHLLDSILTELERTLPCDASAIWLVEPRTSDEDTSPPRFQLGAIHSQEGKITPEYIEKTLDDIPDSRAWLAEALNTTEPLIRSQSTNSNTAEVTDPFGTILNFKENYSIIAAPLRAGDVALGVLTLAHHTPGRYGAESQAMTATFASYAAVAIENARLYESTHDQAWVSTVLLQVAEATQSLTDIDELLATVVQITPLLVGVNACALMMWDDDAEAFVPSAAHGLTTEQQADFDQWIVLPGEEPAFDQLRVSKTPILLSHWSFAKPAGADDPVEGEKLDNQDRESRPLVLFPMVVQDNVLGGMLVDFAGTEFRSEDDFDNEEFLHEGKLAVIQGIAHQTAIAVENYRLLKAQREEAYVSVALLQVAQAVVSLIDLNDILETIVRIAPILVGVNRVAIFLWDESREGSWLAQSYGLPREVEDFLATRFYTPGEFPILDAVYERNKLVHVAIEHSPSQPTEWEQLIPDIDENPLVNEDSNPDATLTENDPEAFLDEPDYKEALLKHFGCLFYAYPLSVKGTVLGVFLAEEAPSPTEVYSYHVRERRLEILTGITQQAALAIQNDRLQNEVVERERLEREMQLARSIQRTFLPQQLPVIPHWDLDTRWRTARQVGGDFYDLINLPNGKLGLVIADVADKGMPAALFMTLVRTLIRAAVHDEDSPAVVLEEVNHLMIPDTQNGMFVTVIYAIISLDTGNMVYANAGHNIPLLLNTKTNDVHPLMKGGIALGILDDIHLEDHHNLIEPGDCVIFYTDGVTEAFSPDGDMYGEEHLQQVIRNAGCENANLVLDAIDRSVNEFIGDNPRADDLTMVAIRRVEV